jgi:hypothetical protein
MYVMFFNDFESRDSLLNPGYLLETHIHTMRTIKIFWSVMFVVRLRDSGLLLTAGRTKPPLARGTDEFSWGAFDGRS